jgi:hypothetical protein
VRDAADAGSEHQREQGENSAGRDQGVRAPRPGSLCRAQATARAAPRLGGSP